MPTFTSVERQHESFFDDAQTYEPSKYKCLQLAGDQEYDQDDQDQSTQPTDDYIF